MQTPRFCVKEKILKKTEHLKFYIVKEQYINYLSQFDAHVSWNKQQKRPYIGIVLKIEKFFYFAPLYSYKPNYNKYKENSSYLRIKDRKGKNISIIRFSEMIPVPKSEIILLDFDSQGDKYRDLLNAENTFINKNKNKVYSKAKKIYQMVVISKMEFYMRISCDFSLLEQKMTTYLKEKGSKQINIENELELITYGLNNSITKVKTILKENNFNLIKQFKKNDIYMYNNDTGEFGIIDDKISSFLIIRSIDEKCKYIICSKNKDSKNLNKKLLALRNPSIELVENFLNLLGYSRLINLTEINYLYEDNSYFIFVQEVFNLGIFFKIKFKDNYINIKSDKLDKLFNLLSIKQKSTDDIKEELLCNEIRKYTKKN